MRSRSATEIASNPTPPAPAFRISLASRSRAKRPFCWASTRAAPIVYARCPCSGAVRVPAKTVPSSAIVTRSSARFTRASVAAGAARVNVQDSLRQADDGPAAGVDLGVLVRLRAAREPPALGRGRLLPMAALHHPPVEDDVDGPLAREDPLQALEKLQPLLRHDEHQPLHRALLVQSGGGAAAPPPSPPPNRGARQNPAPPNPPHTPAGLPPGPPLPPGGAAGPPGRAAPPP